MNRMGRSKVGLVVFLYCLYFTTSCTSVYKSAKVNETLYSINKGVPVDTSILSFYYPYKVKIDSQINVVVAHASTEIKRGRPEGRLNNLTADAIAKIAQQQNI